MVINRGKQVTFTNVGENDHLPYAKADITKVSRVLENFSISFYQFDYQAMALNLALSDASNSDIQNLNGKEVLMPVGKIVLNKQGFQQLHDEITQIYKKVTEEEK